ncbi:N-acetylglucosaminyldiphosphodolichol N-acetylglucosaminyltransferase catalytic subunit alg13 [Polyrhizophydium stewartii]|uniref:UDP-N-acetylglucosamine transferase subunit ALG13 n=1 Tax=Polyrhizophydium stewartii TaxID=2732419 RepID=A0ABR4NDF4_9FUNG
MHHLFVTVGTTEFDRLVAAVLAPPFLAAAAAAGFGSLAVQLGRSPAAWRMATAAAAAAAAALPAADGAVRWADPATGIAIEAFTLKPSLEPDMRRAARIVSHAGAGSVLEALDLHRPLLVVANPDLMDNHQQELATALQRLGVLVCADSPDDLVRVFESADFEALVPLGRPDPAAFSSIMLEAAGLPIAGASAQ